MQGTVCNTNKLRVQDWQELIRCVLCEDQHIFFFNSTKKLQTILKIDVHH